MDERRCGRLAVALVAAFWSCAVPTDAGEICTQVCRGWLSCEPLRCVADPFGGARRCRVVTHHFDDGTAIALCETATVAGDVAVGGVLEVRPSADTSTRPTPRPSWMAALGEHGDVAALVYALEVLGTPAVATGREIWLSAVVPGDRAADGSPAWLRAMTFEVDVTAREGGAFSFEAWSSSAVAVEGDVWDHGARGLVLVDRHDAAAETVRW